MSAKDNPVSNQNSYTEEKVETSEQRRDHGVNVQTKTKSAVWMMDQTPPQMSRCSRREDNQKGWNMENTRTKKDNNVGEMKTTPALPAGPTPVPDLGLDLDLDHLDLTLSPYHHAMSC